MLTIEKRRRWIFLVGLLLVLLALSLVAPHLVKFLDVYEVAVTATATAFIAWFTWTLKRSTDRLWQASKDQLEASDAASKRQLRAYVGITGAPIDNRNPSRWIVGVDYWNHGATPAHNVTGSLSVQLMAIEPYPAFPAAEEWPGSWVMVPNAHATPDRALPLTDEEQRSLVSDTKAVFVWGHISYDDVFRWRINVTFRYRARRKIDGSGWQLHPEAEGNDTTYFPSPKNAVDQGC